MNEVARIFFSFGYHDFGRAPIRVCFQKITLLVFFNLLPILSWTQGLDDILETADEYYQKEQYHTAAEYYQVAAGMQHNNPETTFKLAQSYKAIFNYTLAAHYFHETMQLDEVSYPASPFYFAQMQKSMGNFKKARDGFENFINTNRKSSFIPTKEREEFIKQAEIEKEGCSWAIDQLGKSWKEMGFTILPEPVNSPNNDYAAVVIGDDPVITITSGKKGVKGGLVDNRFGEYFTDNFRYKQQENAWLPDNSSDHFDRTNTKFSDGVGTYNTSGDKYYFTSCYEGSAFCKLYVTYKENGVWKNPQLLNENVNAPGYDNKHPTLTKNGDTLIFVSNRPGGAGGNDIWFSVSTNGEEWQSSKPLQGNINTPFNEASPYYHQGNLLFFSSDGHVGMGGMDIYMAEDYRSSDSKIQNLGTPFNSGFDDSFFSLGKDKGYLSSNRPYGYGKFDIYGFNLPTEEDRLADYLEESADGTQLRSRIRTTGAGSLTAARDEDQFYYDNLTAEERARLERILNLKKAAIDGFDPSELSKEDLKYYRKLDIATKAIIERLVRRRALELEGLAADNLMNAQEKLDWEFYQNTGELEKAIIDRIINLRVVGRQTILASLTPEEQRYSLNPANQERIDDKVRLKTIDSLAESLQEQRQMGTETLNQNINELPDFQENLENTKVSSQLASQRLDQYQTWMEAMGPEFQLQYQRLNPEQRDALHKSTVRGSIIENQHLSEADRQRLLHDLGLTVDPLETAFADFESPEFQMTVEMREMLSKKLHQSGPPDQQVNPRQQMFQELAVLQIMLQQQLEQIKRRETNAKDLQQQLQKALEEQNLAGDPVLEEKIVEEYYSQSLRLLPLLPPKESYYFHGLSPGQQLRLDRLAKLVETQTQSMVPNANNNKSIETPSYPMDQWYYDGLSHKQQAIVDTLVAFGWSPEFTYREEISNFIAGLSDLERVRLDRMMGNQKPMDLTALINKEISPSSYQSSEFDLKTQDNKANPMVRKEAQEIPKNAEEGTFYPGTKIYFDFDQYSLRPEAKVALSELKDFIGQQERTVNIMIEGHTDNIGNSFYNQQLGMRRGKSAANVLQSSSSRITITTKSLGEEQPAHSNDSRMGRQFNRRVEVTMQGTAYPLQLRTYLVKPGATLSKIADKTGVSMTMIIDWNGLSGDLLYAYQPLRLPQDLDYSKINDLLYYPFKIQSTAQVAEYHTVTQGENLFILAQKYQTTVQALEDINSIEASDVMPGQTLQVR